jgi:polar amino acid transport system ATP-binding protein
MTHVSAARAKGSGPNIIRYRGVIKRFGSFTALNGVDLDVHAGEVVCLIGPSGLGKSTLLRCTNGLETIDGGDIEFEGALLPKDDRALRAVRTRMGMVFQSFELFPHLTAQQNVAEGPRTVQKVGQAEADRRASAMLAKVGLADKAPNYPSALSGGQQQRGGDRPRARDGAGRHAVRRADVRTRSGDDRRGAERDEGARRRRDDDGRRHARDDVRAPRRRLGAVFDAGRIVEQGPPAQIFEAPATERTRDFLSHLGWSG